MTIKRLLPIVFCLLLLCGCAQTGGAPAETSAPLATATPEPTAVPTATPEPTPEPIPLYGVWQYEGLEQYLVFSENGTWQLYNDAGLYREGIMDAADDLSEVSLYLLDGMAFPGEDNVIHFVGSTGTDWDGDTLLPSVLPEFPASVADELGLTGVWKYADFPLWIVICPGGGWTQYTSDYDNYYDTYGSVLYRDPPVLFNTVSKFDMTMTLETPDADTAVDPYGYTLYRVDALWAE